MLPQQGAWPGQGSGSQLTYTHAHAAPRPPIPPIHTHTHTHSVSLSKAVPLCFHVTPLVIRQQQGPPGFSVAIAIAQASDESRPSDLSEPLETTTAAMFSYIIFALVGNLVAAAIDLSAVEDHTEFGGRSGGIRY